MTRRRTILVLVLILLVAAGGGVWFRFLRPHLPPAERGRRLAQASGCFNCHGPGGIRGAPNPGRPYPEVPNFESDVMMYAQDAKEIRQWIRDGVTTGRRESESWKRERDASLLAMPAFGDRFSDRELDDLVAFVQVTAGRGAPKDTAARAGWSRARALGCFGCHGPGGRFAPPNPGSLKGYIPSWKGADFSDVVHDETEFRQWVEHGISERFRKNRLARVFLERAAIEMPAFERFLEPGDVEAIWAYVQALRAEAP